MGRVAGSRACTALILGGLKDEDTQALRPIISSVWFGLGLGLGEKTPGCAALDLGRSELGGCTSQFRRVSRGGLSASTCPTWQVARLPNMVVGSISADLNCEGAPPSSDVYYFSRWSLGEHLPHMAGSTAAKYGRWRGRRRPTPRAAGEVPSLGEHLPRTWQVARLPTMAAGTAKYGR